MQFALGPQTYLSGSTQVDYFWKKNNIYRFLHFFTAYFVPLNYEIDNTGFIVVVYVLK